MARAIRLRGAPVQTEKRAEKAAFAGEPSFGDFLRCVRDSSDVASARRYGAYEAKKRLEETYKTGYVSVQKATMGELSGSTGGYLVPQEISLELMDSIVEHSFIYPRADVIPMGSMEVRAPGIDVESVPVSTGQTPLTGGVVFRWGASPAPQETEPKFKSLTLTAWDLIGYAVVSNQWLGDAGPAGEQKLVETFGKAAAWYAEYAFLQGAGAESHMPLGVVNAPAAIAVTRAGASHINGTDLAGMASKLLPYSWSNSIFACSPTCLADIMKLTDFVVNAWHYREPGAAGFLLSRPLFVTEKLPPLGTRGDIVLFDPSLYVIGNRQEVLVDVSPHPGFANYQTDFRVWLRLDGKPRVSKSITLQDKSTVVSPYVVVAA